MSAFSAIYVFSTQSHSAKFLNWADHVSSAPDLATTPPLLFKENCADLHIRNM